MLILFCLVFCVLFLSQNVYAKKSIIYNESLYSGLKYRCIGPFRGGRSAAVTGVPGDPMTYYFGGTWRRCLENNQWQLA